MNRKKRQHVPSSAEIAVSPAELRPEEPVGNRDAFLAVATAFLASLCVMAMEVGAGRILSRHHGASLSTWTSVIGVILSGLTLGNYLGGRLADRMPSRQLLARLLVAGSVSGLLVLVLGNSIIKWGWMWGLNWRIRTATHMGIVFLLPSTILGMVGPAAARIALAGASGTGRTLGSLYAWSTVGSIAGTFLAGFYLIAVIGPEGLLWGVVLALAAGAVAVARSRRLPTAWSGVAVVLVLVGTGPWSWARSWGESLRLRARQTENVLFEKESPYSNVRLVELADQPGLRYMYLDKLLHSQMILNEPDNLLYEYEQIFAVLTRRFAQGKEKINSLTIGGGGCVFPSYINRHWPGSRTDVVEIDPVVTEAARVGFGLTDIDGLYVHHLDGRNFVEGLLRGTQAGETVPAYDFIYGDAYNDVAVPYHLTTVEFVRRLSSLLSADGLYLANVIENFVPGNFLAAMVETIGQVFPHTYLICPVADATGIRLRGRTTFVIVGAKRALDMVNLRLGAEVTGRELAFWPVKESDIQDLRSRCRPVVLSDDYAPVDQLLEHLQETQITPSFEPYHDRAVRLAEKGDTAGAIAAYREALQMHPMHVPSMNNLANLLMGERQTAEAAAIYAKALEFMPRNYKIICNYGSALDAIGRRDEAMEQFRLAVQLKPDFARARNNLGVGLARMGRFTEAAEQFAEAVRTEKDYVEARGNLGSALASMGRFAEAEKHFSEIVQARPNDADAQCNLAAALEEQGKLIRAVEHYRAAIRINAGHVRAAESLAWLAATSPEDSIRNGAEALALAEQVVQMTAGQDPGALDVLAAAYAETGRFDEAVAMAERAAALATGGGKQDLAQTVDARLKLYRAGRAYRDRPHEPEGQR